MSIDAKGGGPMRRLIVIAVSVLAALVSAAPAFAGIDVNHNELFVRDLH
jgi:hypothetical protein